MSTDDKVDGMLNSINRLEAELNGKLKPIEMSDDDWTNLQEMLENPPEPNEALREALKDAVEKGFL